MPIFDRHREPTWRACEPLGAPRMAEIETRRDLIRRILEVVQGDIFIDEILED